MGHLRRVDTTASMSARPQKAAVLLRYRALALRAKSRLMQCNKKATRSPRQRAPADSVALCRGCTIHPEVLETPATRARRLPSLHAVVSSASTGSREPSFPARAPGP